MSRPFLATVLALTLTLQPMHPAIAQAAAAEADAFNVRNADIRAFIQDVARATGTNFIVDPRVQGTVNFSNDQPMSESELLGVLLTILRANGLIAVPAGAGTYRVVPDDTAAQQPRSAGGSATGFATDIIPLQRVDARIAAETIKPLVGRGGVVIATAQGNSLLVADYADNLRRIRGLIAQIDSDRASIDTVTLRNSSAREIAATVNQLFGMGGEGGNAAMSILPVPSSNSIVVRGSPEVIQRVVQMVLELDRRAESTGDLKVVQLQHASAEQLLPVLQQLVGQPTDATGSGAQAQVSTGPSGTSIDTSQGQLISAVPGKRPTLVRAPGQNALIINADPETQRTLLGVIKQLDVRRQQVLVEAIVVEISDDAASELGAQIAAANKDGVPFGVSQFRNSGPGITELAGAALLKDDDSDLAETARNAAMQSLLGLTGGLAGIAGSAGDTLFGLIINAVKTDNGSNLLSTPSIMTLDNEPARILVGQEVPVTSGEVLGDSNSNPFRTIDRQDVGIQLEVTPQINAGGGITLQLRQEVSSVAGPVSADFDELILNKREIETRVLVDDGAIVVLGGLLDQAERSSVDKVPLLGDIPILGSLFRSTARSKDKTNLMVFIRPTIVGGPEDAQRVTAPRYDYMRNSQLRIDDGKQREAALDVLVRDYLRTQPPVVPPAGTTPVPAAAPLTPETLPTP
ncbi:type II secretion system secretin GspD [Lysobacter sp. F6437]|uniref:type II secretion system secretin GspD n=1 Tax=Lysobacter sp. F6437 TaxID=3459296 RepID=UPI00403D60F8